MVTGLGIKENLFNVVRFYLLNEVVHDSIEPKTCTKCNHRVTKQIAYLDPLIPDKRGFTVMYPTCLKLKISSSSEIYCMAKPIVTLGT